MTKTPTQRKEGLILLLGGTGFIGTALAQALGQAGQPYALVSRNLPGAKQRFPLAQVFGSLPEVPSNLGVKAIINLAGAGIADAPWTVQRKQLLTDSRVQTTAAAAQLALRLESPPECFLQGSAYGIYGTSLEADFAEDAPPAGDFLGRLAAAWEQAAQPAAQRGTRLVFLRTSLVLGLGGALTRMLPPFRWGLGGPLGSGQQWMSWIHLADQVGAMLHLLHSPQAVGPFNLAAGAVTNAAFAAALAQALGRPAWLRLPAWALKLSLGEMSLLLLQGQRVQNRKLLESGYQFQYPELSTALAQILA